MFFHYFLYCVNQIVHKTLKVSDLSCEYWLPSFHLNWNNVPLQFQIRALLYEHKRHGSEQDGHDEQVIVDKHVCKCETIAFRATVCLWISTVIVSSQLGYLHNQLSGPAILRFPFPPHYNWLAALYTILFMHNCFIYACICAALCWKTGSD